MIKAICTVGLLPCPYQTLVVSEEFGSCQELIDYFGLEDGVIDAVDEGNESINDFLRVLGLPLIEEDETENPYEGWTDEMIAKQQEEDRRDEYRAWVRSNSLEPWNDGY